MKKLLLVAALLCTASIASAQTVTCGVTGLTSAQTALVAKFIANLNATAAGGSPFTDFPAYCAYTMRQNVLSYVATQQDVDAGKVGAAAKAHGDEVSITAHCTAAGLGAGCLKSQVACFVLSGNTACN
jgi:hypothetical protein